MKNAVYLIKKAVKDFKSGTKSQVNNNIKRIYADDINRNFVWMLTSLCWAISFTVMGFGTLIATLIIGLKFSAFFTIAIVIGVYMLLNSLMGSWIDQRKWRRNLLEGGLLIGILYGLFSSSFLQLFNLGTLMFAIFSFTAWKKYFYYRHFYKMAVDLEEGDKILKGEI